MKGEFKKKTTSFIIFYMILISSFGCIVDDTARTAKKAGNKLMEVQAENLSKKQKTSSTSSHKQRKMDRHKNQEQSPMEAEITEDKKGDVKKGELSEDKKEPTELNPEYIQESDLVKIFKEEHEQRKLERKVYEKRSNNERAKNELEAKRKRIQEKSKLISNQGLLTNVEIKKILEKNIKGNLSDFQKNRGLSKINKFTNNLSSLYDKFGRDNLISIKYKDSFIQDNDLEKSAISILPLEIKKLGKGHKANELFGVLMAEKLDIEKAKFLSDLTGRVFSPTPQRFDDYIILEIDKEYVKLRTVNYIKKVDLANLFTKLNLKKEAKVIVKGKVTNDLIRECAKRKIRYIRSYDSFIRNYNLSPSKIKFIYIASKERSLLKSLLEIDENQVDEMMVLVNKIDKKENAIIVDSREKLVENLKSIKNKNEVPIVVFHNKDNLLFQKDISSFDFNGYITCNSYEISDYNSEFITTDFISLQGLFSSIEKTTLLNTSNEDEFWYHLISEYNSQTSFHDNQKNVVTLVINGTITGAISFALYHTIFKED